MGNIAIRAEGVGKAYQLGEFSTGTLSRDIERWWGKVRGKEDTFYKLGETNDRTSVGKSDIVWSLKDIDFDINKGDAVGIIGRNGAGKSTLLKVLSRVTTPTVGNIKIKGRIASLLEVGTGFHPELTGRENIYLNGAILGMRKAEITKHFDAIVDFAGVERYVDTPVKRYSSGMYVRLAFAVAAHLESEILIVDEVLAVGDAEFQRKCLGKMNDVSKGEGRTVLFVSHNIGSISLLCNKGIYLRNGLLDSIGGIDNIINNYVNQNNQNSNYVFLEDKESTYFRNICFKRSDSSLNECFLFNEDVVVEFEIANKDYIKDLHLSIIVKDVYESPIFSSHFLISEDLQAEKFIKITSKIPKNTLIPSNYKIEPLLHVPNKKFVDKLDDAITFTVEDNGNELTIYANANLGKVVINVGWDHS